jgi:hypothetical protein
MSINLNKPEDSSFQQPTPIMPTGGMQPQIPNATTVLVLGILSIVLCCCYGIFGIASGIIALIMHKQALALYQANPTAYSIASYKNLNAGKICAIIGVILSALMLIYVVFVFLIYGAAALSNPSMFRNYR